MYFLYLLIICYISILLTPVNTYVVLAGNLNAFRSLAKKYAPKSLVGQIKAMVLENGHKYYKEPSEDDDQVDRTVEYVDDSQQDDSYEVATGLKKRLLPVNIYQVKSASKAQSIAPLATPTVLTIDDIVEKVKQRLFQQTLDKGFNGRYLNAQANTQAGSAQKEGSLAYKYFPKKSFKTIKAKAQVENPGYESVPMKVIKEEVQFEATYEDTFDKDLKPQIQYAVQVSPKKNKFMNTQYGGGEKKVRFVKQVLVPANSNQGKSAYVLQPSIFQQPMQQPSLGPQPSIMQLSNLEPQLSSMQQSSVVQTPVYPQLDHQANIDQSTIMKQLVLMQQQIEQLNKTAQQTDLKKESPSLKIPQLNIEAVEGNFQITENSTATVQKTNDGKEDQVEPSKEITDESVLSEESTIAPVVTEPSTKALTVPGKVDNEQFTEENEVVQNSAETVHNDDEAAKETTPEEINEEEDIKPDTKSVEGIDKNTKLDTNAKVHTQEFGNSDAGEPIVAKTYNFDKPNVEADREPVNLKIPVDSARKVMLF